MMSIPTVGTVAARQYKLTVNSVPQNVCGAHMLERAYQKLLRHRVAARHGRVAECLDQLACRCRRVERRIVEDASIPTPP